jgi:hypothetical protein
MTEPNRLAARLAQEETLLRQAYPGARIDRESLVVVLSGHRLPAGWSHDETDVLFPIPLNYPAGRPDNICARPDLTLANGGTPGNSQGVQVHAGKQWLQFSYHVEPGDWRPTADPASGSNLAEYLAGALTRFQEAD